MSHYTVLAAVELPEPDVEYLSQNRLALQVEGQLDDLLAPYEAVSYTHLDVYKRQSLHSAGGLP